MIEEQKENNKDEIIETEEQKKEQVSLEKEEHKETVEEQKEEKKEKQENKEVKKGKNKKNIKEDSEEEKDKLFESVVSIKRVSKVVKGGKNFSFSSTVVVGDANGQVGIGLGKSNEVMESIKKGTNKAKNSFVKINIKGETIPHEIIGKFKSSTVMLKPASAGTGVIAGGPVRAMCDAVGIKNILTKSLGSRNPLNVIMATLNGFKKLRLKRRG